MKKKSSIMSRIKFLIIFVSVFFHAIAFADDYPEVLFGNSTMRGNYGYSLVSYSGYSWVENVKGQVPLSDSVSFTPGNALSLKYTSSIRGHWEMSVFYPDNRSYLLPSTAGWLSFRVRSMAENGVVSWPFLALLQGDSCTHKVSIASYIVDEATHGAWLEVAIPLHAFGNLDRQTAVNGVTFYQGRPTGKEALNHLLIDQIEFTPSEVPQTDLAYPAVLDQASAYERHVSLSWQLPLDPGLRYVKIYRSEDGEQFTPVAIRPIMSHRYTDFVPAVNRTYYYQVSWVDHHYQESPMSNVLEVRTAPISDEVLMDVIQEAHIHFFVSRTEINSGMHAAQFLDSDAIVNVEETGYSLLAYTVGLSRDLISNRAYLRRLNTLVDFLSDQAYTYKGMYPLYLDGRTGKEFTPLAEQHVGARGQGVSVSATASLMQGLLVSRNYLKNLLATRQEGRQDRAFRERIEQMVQRMDQLWQRVEWNAFTQDEGMVLYDYWSPVDGFERARPMGGFGADLLSYLLALSSPNYALPEEAYEVGLGLRRVGEEEQPSLDDQADVIDSTTPVVDPVSSDRLQGEEQQQETVLLDGDLSVQVPETGQVADSTLMRDAQVAYESYRTDTLLYGFHLEVGRLDESLLPVYLPFMTFDPHDKKDIFANYGESLEKLIQAYKRRDNEIDAGHRSSDIWGTAQGVAVNSGLPVIVPAISVGSYPFTPDMAMKAMRALYTEYGAALFSEYGFRTWINIHGNRISDRYRALNQAAIPVMIENGRTGLIWSLFMQHEDIDRTVSRFYQEDL